MFVAGAPPWLATAAPGPQADAPANAYEREAYLRRQVALSERLLREGRRAELRDSVDRTLSLIAALQNPEAAPAVAATALSRTLRVMAEAGEAERAWGLYRASGGAIGRALPGGVETALWRLTEAQLLQQAGDLAGAEAALDAGVAALRQAGTAPPVRDGLLAPALSLKAVLAAGRGDLPGARAALAAHPLASLHVAPGRAPASYEEVSYLTGRALVAGLGQTPDPLVAEALRARPGFPMDPATADVVETYRAAGAALAEAPGPARRAGLAQLGRLIRASALRPATAGRWERPGALDQVLVGLALTQAADADPETVFVLAQLSGRAAGAFEADALTVLAQAGDELQRRAAHQALRLRARRDRLERTQIQKVMTRAAGGSGQGGALRHAPETRLLIRDFNVRLAQAEAALAKDNLSLTPAPAVPLRRLQALLATHEAALAVAPTAGGYAYVCVRQDRVTRSLGPVDPAKLRLDSRLVQQALTAGHAPSEPLDVQFPADAAVRLYEALLRPFEACLKPGDRILWLSGVAGAQVPLAALLPKAPPKLARGYDLGAADWLVRRHAIAYAGSAGAIVASRSGARSRDADFDFLGVGDPVLGADPQALLRGVRGGRLEGLAPLPETRDELAASAKGFRSARLLLGERATERTLRGEMVGAYRYLSFATHGLLREDLQGLSEPALVLTPVAAGDPLDDGLFTASDIADLNLRAAFVALSACNTANFDLTQMARDLPALASAFAVAGAPATLGTLWPVDSETSKQVVSRTFEQLQASGAAPADALAAAQRAFLAAPPGRAWLHPRFWAPFVMLGDGGAAPTRGPPQGITLADVEVLTQAGGEVLALDRVGAGVAARFVSDPIGGRQGAAVRLATGGGEAWRREGHETGAARFLVRLGETVVAGGYALGDHGRYAPTLERFDAGGARTKVWRGDGLARVDAFLLAGAATGPQTAVLAVGEVNLRDRLDAGGGRLHVLEVGPDLAPRPLFEVAAPPGARLASATVTPVGGRLLVTYSDDQLPLAGRPPQADDDYDAPNCPAGRTTWLELRDAGSGALLASGEVRGLVAVTALKTDDGSVLLGGSQRGACGEAKAAVVSVDGRLKARTIWADDSLGASDVRTLSRFPGRRVFVAASKENVVEYRPADPAAAAQADPYAILPFPHTYSGLVLTLDAGGRPTAPRLLDSGSNVYVTASEASRPGEILLGGSLGGQAAIFRLTEPAGR